MTHPDEILKYIQIIILKKKKEKKTKKTNTHVGIHLSHSSQSCLPDTRTHGWRFYFLVGVGRVSEGGMGDSH